jgi:hypothetical protein
MIRPLLPIAVLLAISTTSPAEAAARFRAYVACGQSDSTYTVPPSHSCPVGDLPHAVFVDRRRARTTYRLCVRVPSGRRSCRTHRTGGRGRMSQRGLHNDTLGRHEITWHVGGRLIRSWTLHRTIGD